MIGAKLLARLDAKGRKRAARQAVNRVAGDLIARADAARDDGRYAEAALLYAEALRLRPDDAGIHVQAGHMFKESFRPAEAETHYRTAVALAPDDAEAALQLGHFLKTGGRLIEADAAYGRAAEIKPAWPTPRQERERLARAGLMATGDLSAEQAAIDSAAITPQTVPELAPREAQSLLHGHGEGVELRRLGRRERTHWGIEKTLRGIEALRGYCISEAPVLEVQLLLNDQTIYRGPVRGGYPLVYENHRPSLRKYVFNIWFDFSAIGRGAHEIEFRLTDSKRRVHSRRERIVVAPPLDPVATARSDAHFAPIDGADPRPLDAQIDSRPSMVRPSKRAFLREPPRTVLVQRADQLGDLVVSIPAVRRLREFLPEARIVGLLSRANSELARSLALFDEVVEVEFPDDDWERRRIMSEEAQAELRERLAPYAFDMAIDLSENPSSRPLMLLSGAPFLFGSPSGDMPALNVEVAGFTHDRMNGHEVVPHTNKLMAMIGWLGDLLQNHSQVVRRDDVSREMLGVFGLAPDARYAVLHSGARLQFSRWPGYAELARMILAQTDLSIVMLTDGDPVDAALAEDLRVHVVQGRTSFDQFDALLHFAAVFVGNDSGPKHLASLRGAPVVSLHMARNNWNEWGQENGGFIISRKVPCAGCLIWHDPEECGRDFTCIRSITADEVFGAVRQLLDA